jgi:hypothetical protein
MVRQSAGSLSHVLFKTGCEPVGRRHPHVRRAPAGISAGLVFARFFEQGDIDAQAAALRLFGRRQRGREAGSAMADDNEF